MRELTEKQQRTLEHIREFFGNNGRMPTYSEIAEITRVSNSTAYHQVQVLVHKGKLTLVPRGKNCVLGLANTEMTCPHCKKKSNLSDLIGEAL